MTTRLTLRWSTSTSLTPASKRPRRVHSSAVLACAQGHHYRHWDDASFAAIPLFQPIAPMRCGLLEAASPPFPIDDCIDSILHAGICPGFLEMALVDDSPMKVIAWDDYSDRRYDRMRTQRSRRFVRSSEANSRSAYEADFLMDAGRSFVRTVVVTPRLGRSILRRLSTGGLAEDADVVVITGTANGRRLQRMRTSSSTRD